jgi:CRISPR/Cas system endoribonuclease Cas6 (RAMP superfamily)
VPRYVFQSALRQWEALSPAHLPIPIASFLEHYVWVSHFQIRPVRASFVEDTQKVMGFAGRVEVGLAWRDKLLISMRRDWRHYVDVLRLLAAFAFYAGTGAQTTRGLGQTLPLASDYARS